MTREFYLTHEPIEYGSESGYSEIDFELYKKYINDIFDNVTLLKATIEAQEIIIKDMAQPKIEFIDTSCMRCKNVNDCSLCENVKNKTGMKLREMSFVCFETKVQL